MKNKIIMFLSAFGAMCFIASCGGSSSTETTTGKATFVLGGSTVRKASKKRASGRLNANSDYIVSPNQAKITFTSIAFRGTGGDTLSTATLTDCVVTYDRSNASGTSLLDCPFDVPVGTIAQISVAFSTTVQLLIDDSGTGIYTNSATTTGFTTTDPGVPDFVSFVVTAGSGGTERSTPVIFPEPITVTAGSSPQIFITTDMLHSLQLTTDGTGTSLGPLTVGTNDPVALFGGPTKGSSRLYSTQSSVDAYEVNGAKQIRMFVDDTGKPLYLIGYTCGVDGPKGAWASPPIGATLGGWLGKDSADKISWALPADTSYSSYGAYFVMPDQATVGGTTTVDCKVEASPPEPADGLTYASGAPTLTSPTTSTVLNLLAK